jgi:L-amino acid N-acyltransferase YncA
MSENYIQYRTATENDSEQIVNIWLNGIESTFGGIKKPIDIKAKFLFNFYERNEYEFWVAEYKGNIIGFQSYLPLSKNPIKNEYIVESSTYIDNAFINKGVGYKLLVHSLIGIKSSKIQSVIAFISSANTTTIKIAEKLGFFLIGTVPALGLFPEKKLYLKSLLHD